MTRKVFGGPISGSSFFVWLSVLWLVLLLRSILVLLFERGQLQQPIGCQQHHLYQWLGLSLLTDDSTSVLLMGWTGGYVLLAMLTPYLHK